VSALQPNWLGTMWWSGNEVWFTETLVKLGTGLPYTDSRCSAQRTYDRKIPAGVFTPGGLPLGRAGWLFVPFCTFVLPSGMPCGFSFDSRMCRYFCLIWNALTMWC
jgi:hypothetical protein